MFENPLSKTPPTGSPEETAHAGGTQQPSQPSPLEAQISRAGNAALPLPPSESTTPMTAHDVSTLEVAETQTEKTTALKDYSGHAWECIDIQPGPYGGYIRSYKLDPKFDTLPVKLDMEKWQAARVNYIELIESIYPAVEPDKKDVMRSTPELSIHNTGDYRTISHSRESLKTLSNSIILGRLGFRHRSDGEDAFFVELPDREELIANWKILMRQLNINHELNIAPSVGIATHIDFIKAVRNYDALLSQNTEFIHDMFFHVIPVILMILQMERDAPGSFLFAKETRANFIDRLLIPLETLIDIENKFGAQKEALPPQVQALIERRPALEASIGYYVDVLAAVADIREIMTAQEFYLQGLSPATLARARTNIFQNLFACDPTMTEQWQYLSLLNQLVKALPALKSIDDLPAPSSEDAAVPSTLILPRR